MNTHWLRPLGALYGWLTHVRAQRYTKNSELVYQPAQYTISVGNLTVGGTGKTPLVELLLRGLRGESVATLSRGYGRRTRGFRIVTSTDTASSVGDEPLQLWRKFGRAWPNHYVTVCVGEDRAGALDWLRRHRPDISTVVLDDAFQHLTVRPHRNLLLTDYNRPFWTDYPFPAGRLREGRPAAARADAVLVTKCPAQLSAADRAAIEAAIRPYAPTAPVFFAGLTYAEPRHYVSDQPLVPRGPVVLVTGIAAAGPLVHYVRQRYGLHAHRRYADHYVYTPADWQRIRRETPADTTILTTEKDWVKLSRLVPEAEQGPLAYLPVETTLLADEAAFWNVVGVKKP